MTAEPSTSQRRRMGPPGQYTLTLTLLQRSNPSARRDKSQATRFFLAKAPDSTPVPGLFLVWPIPESKDMYGTRIGIRFVPGWRWLARQSRRFRNSLGTRRSLCLPDTAICPLSTVSPSSIESLGQQRRKQIQETLKTNSHQNSHQIKTTPPLE